MSTNTTPIEINNDDGWVKVMTDGGFASTIGDGCEFCFTDKDATAPDIEFIGIPTPETSTIYNKTGKDLYIKVHSPLQQVIVIVTGD